MQQTDSTTLVAGHIHAVVPYADLIGWNEAGTAPIRDVIRTLPGFGSFIPPGSAGSVCISWRSADFKLVSSASVKVHGGVTGITPSRFINSVRLRDLASGVVFTRINTHVVHHIEVDGHPRVTGALPGQNDRAKLHFKMLHDAIAAAELLGPVVAGGDMNVDYLAEKRATVPTPWFPLSLMSTVATAVMPTHGTHGTRCIDWTWVAGAVKALGVRTLPHGSSDHDPVQSTLQLT